MRAYLAFVALVGILCSVQVHGQKRKQCVKDGKTFVGSYVTDDCRQKCRCTKGKVKCKLLCPSRKRLTCRSDEEVSETKKYKGKNRKCYCLARKCVKKGGEYCRGPDGKQYKEGALFIPSDCSGKCHCVNPPVNGKPYTCTPLCSNQNEPCKYFEVAEEYREKVSGDCFCKRHRCVPRTTGCHGSDNKFYPYGVKFVTADCGAECICNTVDSPTPTCTGSVCPWMEVQCVYGDSLDYYNKTFEGSGCICPRVRCKKESCYYQPEGKLYPIRKDFVTQDCSLRCKCHEDGSYNCDPLCLSPGLRCPSNEEIVYVEEKVDQTNCVCKKPKCRAISSCFYPDDNKKIQMGEEYVTRNCRLRCRCSPDGGYRCDPLCPLLSKNCETNEQIVYKDYYYKNSHCLCRKPECEKIGSCHYPGDNVKIRMGEEYVTRDCRFRCKCTADGGYNCDALCPYVPRPNCLTTEQIAYTDYYYKNSRCLCRKPECKAIDSCLYPDDNAKIRMGEEYATRDCRYRCRCTQDGGYTCDALCPSTYIRCPPGQRVFYEDYNVYHCRCRRAACRNRG